MTPISVLWECTRVVVHDTLHASLGLTGTSCGGPLASSAGSIVGCDACVHSLEGGLARADNLIHPFSMCSKHLSGLGSCVAPT